MPSKAENQIDEEVRRQIIEEQIRLVEKDRVESAKREGHIHADQLKVQQRHEREERLKKIDEHAEQNIPEKDRRVKRYVPQPTSRAAGAKRIAAKIVEHVTSPAPRQPQPRAPAPQRRTRVVARKPGYSGIFSGWGTQQPTRQQAPPALGFMRSMKSQPRKQVSILSSELGFMNRPSVKKKNINNINTFGLDFLTPQKRKKGNFLDDIFGFWGRK